MKTTKRTLKTLFITLIMMLCMTTGCSKVETEEVVREENSTEEVNIEATATENLPVEITPVETEIASGADFDKIEKLTVGKYSISGVSIEVFERDNGRISARITDGTNVENVDTPALIKNGESTYLYGKVDYCRTLERVQILANSILEKEEDVIWTDFPSNDVKKCAGEYNLNSFATFGETVTDNGWHYAIYANGEELAGLDFSSRLKFWYDEGVAVSQEGDVYLLYFTVNSMQAYKVDLPEKVNPEKDFVSIDDRYSNGYGFASVYVDDTDKFYIIRTEEIETLKMNGLNHLDKGFEPLKEKPSYTVINGNDLSNYDKYSTWFGGDAQTVGVTCYLNYNEDYTYRYDKYLDDTIQNSDMECYIPTEQLDAIWNKEFLSYDEFKNATNELQKLLDFYYEETNGGAF